MTRMLGAAALAILAACSGTGPAETPPESAGAAAPEETLPAAPEPAPVPEDEGARLYAGTCAGCHDLPDVKSRSDGAWEAEVRRMRLQKKVKLTPRREKLIVEHLQRVNGKD